MIALLRAVNVGGRGMLAMAALRETIATLGFTDVRTVLQSGNVVLRSGAQSAPRVERAVEQVLAERHGVRSDVMVRTASAWRAAVERNPFPNETARGPAYVMMIALKDAVDAAAVAALQGSVVGREIVRGEGREIYAYYPDGMGRSRLTIPAIERTLGTRATARNWNTVRKLAEAAYGDDDSKRSAPPR